MLWTFGGQCSCFEGGAFSVRLLRKGWIRTYKVPARLDVVMVVEIVSVVLAGAERTLEVMMMVSVVEVVSVTGIRVVVTAGAVETTFVVTEKYSTIPVHDT